VAADHTSILRIIQASKAAGAAGRSREAEELLARATQLAPAHPAVLNERGLQLLQRGEAAGARELFERATSADPNHPALWSNLAASLHALGLPGDEMAAIERALAIEPRHPPALLQKAALIEQRGDPRSAARIYRAALVTVGPETVPPPSLRAALEHAREAVRADDAALARTLEERLAPVRAQHGSAAARRADQCIDLITGHRSRYLPQPTFMYFPGIPALEFFDNGEFPWLGAIEAATEAIRAELTAVLASDQAGLEPYVAYPEGVPLDQWRELNRSRRWSAYFLWNQGVAQPQHLARCPRTAQAVGGAPQCDVERHGPNVFFSILEPRTRIPPHTGVTNARLTVHLPLIVPPGCGFRVGSETRAWIPGRAWVFDDTIEHEAWNDSDTPRAILIFDIWNPYLTQAERDLVRTATEAIGSYYGGPPPGLV
jgi:aspartyl/asparaginyl beta-hydroxylase (cupin superfamily)/Tfp pilus assembly protein PilF